MSQAKVDYNKEQKYNRKKLVKKQKRARVLGTIAATLVAVALIGWVGFSTYSKYEEQKEATITKLTLDSSALSDYTSGLSD
ncbi:MAG: hypothetical protein PUB19_07185 [Lachnospiraceae bacterium]|nr:hypothetical protein [Lachnospiraceae bacterium]